MQAIGEFNYESASAYAELNGLKLRSVIAKVKSLQLPYTAKERVTKTGEVVVRKAELVAVVEAATGLKVPSLVKASKVDLVALSEWFKELAEDNEAEANVAV